MMNDWGTREEIYKRERERVRRHDSEGSEVVVDGRLLMRAVRYTNSSYTVGEEETRSVKDGESMKYHFCRFQVVVGSANCCKSLNAQVFENNHSGRLGCLIN